MAWNKELDRNSSIAALVGFGGAMGGGLVGGISYSEYTRHVKDAHPDQDTPSIFNWGTLRDEDTLLDEVLVWSLAFMTAMIIVSVVASLIAREQHKQWEKEVGI